MHSNDCSSLALCRSISVDLLLSGSKAKTIFQCLALAHGSGKKLDPLSAVSRLQRVVASLKQETLPRQGARDHAFVRSPAGNGDLVPLPCRWLAKRCLHL